MLSNPKMNPHDNCKGKRRTTELAIVIRPQTMEEEFEYVWKVLTNIPLLKSQGFRMIALPNHPEFQRLGDVPAGTKDNPKLKAMGKKPLSAMKNSLKAAFEKEYHESDYAQLLEVTKAGKGRINKLTPKFFESAQKWGYKTPSKYEIVLTRYGPFGGLNQKNAPIRVNLETKEKMLDPVKVILHELVHQGVEDTIAAPYGLTNHEKEALVDHICSKLMPDYKRRSLSDNSDRMMEPYLSSQLPENLPAAVAQYIKDHPRK